VASLTAVEGEELQPGIPQWIAPALQVKAGRDPLGLMTITQDRIMPILAPGILALANRARYFTFLPFLLDEFRMRGLAPSNDLLSEFIKLREFELACAVQLCPRGCGNGPSGATGTNAAYTAVRQLDDPAIPRRESVESYLGGYGLYYRTPLIDLGAVIPKGTPYGQDDDLKPTPVDVLRSDERVAELADAYRTAIAETDYYRRWFVGEDPVPRDVLIELAERGCLCRLVDAEDEQALIRDLLFALPEGKQPEFVVRDVEQRRRSFALFLRELELDNKVAGDDHALRQAIWDDFVVSNSNGRALAETVSQWAALAAKDYLQDGLASIFAHLWRAGRIASGADGLTPAGLDELLRDSLFGDELVIRGSLLDYDIGTTTETFVARLRTAAEGTSFRELRSLAVQADTAMSGLMLVLATLDRLPDPEQMPEGWREIGRQSSERQPSLLGFAHLLALHQEEKPTLVETLSWIVHRFVISAHEQIAYSKLPDFTFRFRWENGRLRFYPIGEGRFGLADIRRPAMSQLSLDLGMWERAEGEPTLTTLGREFVSVVFA
jgi:hypothetical protein